MNNAVTAYRPGVGMMVLNDDNKVLVGKRIDSKVEAWQMPQGGIDEGEAPEPAALRELREEVGTDKVDIIATTPDWLYYDLPDELIGVLWNGKYRGQKQRWYLMRLTGSPSDVNINTAEPEFSATMWVTPEELPSLIVPFKVDLYRQIIDIFTPYLHR